MPRENPARNWMKANCVHDVMHISVPQSAMNPGDTYFAHVSPNATCCHGEVTIGMAIQL